MSDIAIPTEPTNTYEFNPSIVTKEEVQSFIGSKFSSFEKNVDFSLASRERLRRTKDKSIQVNRVYFSFVPWSLITGVCWFFYRKMYILPIFLFVFAFALGAFFDISGPNYACAIVPFVAGKFLYTEFSIRTILKLKKKLVKNNAVPKNKEDFLNMLAAKGGVSLTSGIVSAVALLGIAILAGYFAYITALAQK